MFPLNSIRRQVYSGAAILFCVVALLSLSGFQGAYSYRDLTIAIEQRADEFPLVSELIQQTAELRGRHEAQLKRIQEIQLEKKENDSDRFQRGDPILELANYKLELRLDDFRENLQSGMFNSTLVRFKKSLKAYREQLLKAAKSNERLADTSAEEIQIEKIESILSVIELQTSDPPELGEDNPLNQSLINLEVATFELPKILSGHMKDVRDQTRADYRAWMALSGISTLVGVALILGVMNRFNAWFLGPLLILVNSSRRVAAGDFEHRISLKTNREVEELADAMNATTIRFQEIRDDLDLQVRQRTQEVVRSEKLASVGFLAAGVAHEINNPLASIAWSAESLESRLPEVIDPHSTLDNEEVAEEVEVLKKYLRRIQEEAFRCKGITDGLLDFSRMGDVDKQPTDLRELIDGVIEMVQNFGSYRGKTISFECSLMDRVPVVAAEMKQVVLNLMTNALDSVDQGGEVKLSLAHQQEHAVLRVTDNGCGMTKEVQKHLFEPFFTRRRDGQGTGLGLSITYQIIQDHGGNIEVFSKGAEQGSEFQVTLPLEHHDEKSKRKKQAA